MNDKREAKGLLRGGAVVVLTGRSDVPGFPLIGRTFSDGRIELWRGDGRWREDGAPHRLDVTHLITPSGQPVEFLGLAP